MLRATRPHFVSLKSAKQSNAERSIRLKGGIHSFIHSSPRSRSIAFRCFAFAAVDPSKRLWGLKNSNMCIIAMVTDFGYKGDTRIMLLDSMRETK